MRIQAACRPHPLHGVLRDSDRLGHRPATPVGLALRTIVLRQIQDLLNRLLRDRRLTTATLANLAQPCHPILGEPCPPVRHRGRRHDNACAIAELATPCDAINNAFARTTSRCAPDCDRATDSNSSRCPAEISNAATGFLMGGILSNQTLTICETHH